MGLSPRVRGADRDEMRNLHAEGLSPRVRGSHPKLRGEVVKLRSIPAGAGEPPIDRAAD